MPNKNNNAIILLSGGLDSVVSIAKSNCNIKMGIVFDYGQKAFLREKTAAKKIASYYKFSLITVKLNWMKDILNNGLSSGKNAYKPKNLTDIKELEKSMNSVWVPNRNALFVNIAAAYCESYGMDTIIIGANKEEGKTFKDNSKAFINKCNELFKYSVNTQISLVAPLIDMDKKTIIKNAIELDVPLKNIYSCYQGEKKHCGQCESCLHLKQALAENNAEDLIKKLF